MEAELIAHLEELKADNAATGARLRAEQMRDEKEKADIIATVRVFTSYWEKHHPGEPLPPEVAGDKLQNPPLAGLNTASVNLADILKQNLVTAFEQAPVRFSTKEFFPLIPEIQAEEVPESQGYDFLRRMVDEGKLWIYQPGAGRRPTLYSKEPVNHSVSQINGTLARIAENLTPSVEKTVQVLPMIGILP